jgi:hypothetical protein
MALLFTGFAYGAGNHLRPRSGLAHASLLETDGPAPVATSWIGVSRRSKGTSTVELPAAWAVEPATVPNGTEALLPPTGPGRSGVAARLALASGEFGVLKASGPVALPGRLEVTASSVTDGVATGTVRNGLAFPVEEVVVFLGSSRTRVGRLEAGQRRDWTINVASDKAGFDPSGFDTWQRFSSASGRDGAVNLALWEAGRADLGVDQSSPGTAVAVGWTRQWQPTFTVDGRERAAPGRTAVVGRSAVTAGGGRVTDLALRREIVRGPFPGPFGFNDGSVGEPTVVKFTLPDGAAVPPGGFVLHSGFATSSLEVWQNGAWQALGFGGFGVKGGVVVFPGGKRIIGMPAPAPGFTPTTTTVPLPPPVAVPDPSGKPGLQVPSTAMPMPMPLPAGPAQGGGFDWPVPAGAVSNGVVYLRLRIDPSSFSGDSTFTLGATG